MKPEVFNYSDYERLKAENEKQADYIMVKTEHYLRLKAERDALVARLREDWSCGECKHGHTPLGNPPCNRCHKLSLWEWRGVSE